MSRTSLRAFKDVKSSDHGKLHGDHGRSSEAERQFANTGEFMTGGANSAGVSVSGVDSYMVPDCLGSSGEPNNRPIHRPAGHS